MASLTQWTWVWVNSGSCWWTGRPGVLQSMGLQRVRHDWVTELNWTGTSSLCCAMFNHSVVSNSLWPKGCSPPGSSVHGDSLSKHTGVLESVAMPSSRGCFQPRNQNQVSRMQADSLLSEPPGKSENTGVGSLSLLQRIFLHCRQILYQHSYQRSPCI